METNTPKDTSPLTAATLKRLNGATSYKEYKGLKPDHSSVGQAFVMHLKKPLKGMKSSSDKKES